MERRYQAFVAAVERAIKDADPIGLLKGGAPADEYSPEIGAIVPRVGDAQSVDEISAVLHEEFVRWFGNDTGCFVWLSRTGGTVNLDRRDDHKGSIHPCS